MSKKKMMFEEVLLEDTRKINGGIKFPKESLPTRTAGMISPVEDLIPIKTIKFKLSENL